MPRACGVSLVDRSGADRRPLVIAHRGGAHLRPENTLDAFDHARALGADALELDVRLSADGVPVVLHDETLDRTTSARGPVSHVTADQLAHVDAAYHFQPERGHPFRGRGLGVPRLRQVLDRSRHTPVIIELKGHDERLADAVVREVLQADATERVCLGGFGWRMLQAVRRLAPAIATSAAREEVRWALYGSWLGIGRDRVAYRAYHVPEYTGRLRVVSRRFVRLAHRIGIPVQVWTINDVAQAERLLGWGVDGLISDRPDLALEARARWVERRAIDGGRSAAGDGRASPDLQ